MRRSLSKRLFKSISIKLFDILNFKAEILKQLSKAQAEIQLWRSKYETEGLGRLVDNIIVEEEDDTTDVQDRRA